METPILGAVGTKQQGWGVNFPLVVDNNSSFNEFRNAISSKYPWGVLDAVEFRYWNGEKVNWVPVQSDDELAVMFGRNARTMSCNFEVTVIQRTRAENMSSRPSSSRGSRGSGVKLSGTQAQPRSSTREQALVLGSHLELQVLESILRLFAIKAKHNQRKWLIMLWRKLCLMRQYCLMKRM